MTEKKTKTLSHTKRMILWAVSVKPSTALELAGVVGVGISRICRAVRGLVEKGLLFSDSRVKTAGMTARLLKAHIKHPDPRLEVIGKQGHAAPLLAQIVDAIEQAGEPMTVAEITEFIGVKQESVRKAVKYYHCGDGAGRLRVAGWVYMPAKGHGWKPRYCTSPGDDAVKPKSSNTYSRKQWATRNKALQRMEWQRRTVKAGKPSPTYGHPFAQLYAVAGVSQQAAMLMREAA